MVPFQVTHFHDIFLSFAGHKFNFNTFSCEKPSAIQDAFVIQHLRIRKLRTTVIKFNLIFSLFVNKLLTILELYN